MDGPQRRSASARLPGTPAAGGGLPEVLAEGESFCGVAVDATHVYWGGFGTTIGRVGLDGSDPEPSFIAGIDRPCGIALYGSQIYWSRNDPVGRGILTAPLSEPASISTVFGGSLGVPCGVAVDSVQIQPPPPPSVPRRRRPTLSPSPINDTGRARSPSSR